MKPIEGRRRVIVEEVGPTVDGGRYPAKRIVGDLVEITAAIFGDGHDHIAARLLYRHDAQRKWQTATFTALVNDMWSTNFVADKIGMWHFTIEAWVDHFDTWVHDLGKRLAAQQVPQPDPQQPTQQTTPQDIPLALRIGANHIDTAANRAKGDDAKDLKLAAGRLRSLAEAAHSFYNSPLTSDLLELVARYPDTRYSTTHAIEYPLWVDRPRARFSSWYELFPRSASPTPGIHGTLRDVEARLPEIAAMGFDIVYMPPINPIGFAFRKGANNAVTAQPGEVGSPWAIGAPIGGQPGGHTAILPALGTMDDFSSLVNAAHTHGMELALDIAFQCSPDHPWVQSHADWFVKRPDGTIQYAENPPKKYQDIYPINFESADWRSLWDALYGVFEFWIDNGVRVFRVDNPHTKALPFWEWCLAEVLSKAPDVIFLAEAFTRPHVMYSLAKSGYTQSYTYFTWRNTKADLQTYFEEITKPPVSDFFRPNAWPNTPDILHEQLQTGSRAIFQQRVILAATLSASYGIYGPAYELCEGRATKPAPGKTASEEYLDSEKYQLRHWDRSDPISIAPLITTLNRIRHQNAALQSNESLLFHPTDNINLMAYSKSDGANIILTVVNLDESIAHTGFVDLAMDKLGLPWDSSFTMEDLLSGASYTWTGQRNYIALDPAIMPAHIFKITPSM